MTQKLEKYLAKHSPEKVRVSVGSAVLLGLLGGRVDVAPTTAYLMTYKLGKCSANCSFCPQARESLGKANMLSRVSWPAFPTELVFNRIETSVRKHQTKRVCLQALNYPQVFDHLVVLIRMICRRARVPISVSCQPVKLSNMKELAEAGAERIGIPLDAVTKKIFENVKGLYVGGPYQWEKQLRLLKQAVDIFGKGKVSTHLIVGLGETERMIVKTIQECIDMQVLPALFAFTPIRGTQMENKTRPSVQSYRRIQLARYLILHGFSMYKNMIFDNRGRIASFGLKRETLMRIIDAGAPFLTSGCPECNRPFYNEKPSGPIYNYPRTLVQKDLEEIGKQLQCDE